MDIRFCEINNKCLNQQKNIGFVTNDNNLNTF